MRFMPALSLALTLAVAAVTPVLAQVGLSFSSPGVSIGINIPAYPSLVRVPDYPVYYAPGLPENYFFYDGLYWVFQGDNWYQSSWYNGPWYPVAPDAVPLYLLRVPVRYYRHPPAYFHGWRSDAPPRWDQHWGHGWAEQHRNWNHWDRARAPAPAPLPSYQRRYSGDRYPHDAQAQAREHAREYHYQPREQVSRQHYEQRSAQHYEQRSAQQREQRAPQQQHEQRGQGQEQRGEPHGQGQQRGQGHEQRERHQGSGPRDEHGERSGG